MTKSSKAKKFAKAAKLKPILKLSRKLKKSQNETRTEFKARKIVIKEQFEDNSNLIVVDKKNLSIKDLLSRLNHHNKFVKTDAIDRLKEIIQTHEANLYGGYVSAMIKGLGPCFFDLNSSVRKSSIKCINTLVQMNRSKVEPLLDFLVSYSSCAMVHINVDVQEDSLLIIDSIRIMVPLMKTEMVNMLLANFLGLITRKIKESNGKSSSTLVFSPDNVLTHVNWRAKLLSSLEIFLGTILKHYENSEKRILTPCEIRIRHCFPSANNAENDDSLINILTNSESAKNFIKNITEILYITWVETSLQIFTKGKDGKGFSQTQIYEIILNILNHLREVANISEENDPTECDWFCKSISKNFQSKIMKGFPYSSAVQQENCWNNHSWDLNLSIATLAMALFERDSTLKTVILQYFIGILNENKGNNHYKMEKIINVCLKLIEQDSKVELEEQEILLEAALNCFRSMGLSEEKSYVKAREALLILPIRASEMQCGNLQRSSVLMRWVKTLVSETDKDWPAVKDALIQLKLRNPPNFRQTILKCTA